MTGSTLIELRIYNAAIDWLLSRSWRIICACPPTGTDARFHKCRFTKKVPGITKGPRDEVDIIACGDSTLALIECKVKLSDSFTKRNKDGENDLEKLSRIVSTFGTRDLAALIESGYGSNLGKIRTVLKCVAIGVLDGDIPTDAIVLHFDQLAPEAIVFCPPSIAASTVGGIFCLPESNWGL